MWYALAASALALLALAGWALRRSRPYLTEMGKLYSTYLVDEHAPSYAELKRRAEDLLRQRLAEENFVHLDPSTLVMGEMRPSRGYRYTTYMDSASGVRFELGLTLNLVSAPDGWVADSAFTDWSDLWINVQCSSCPSPAPLMRSLGTDGEQICTLCDGGFNHMKSSTATLIHDAGEPVRLTVSIEALEDWAGGSNVLDTNLAAFDLREEFELYSNIVAEVDRLHFAPHRSHALEYLASNALIR